jgi:DNA-binding NarL/FixJ family response regulator
LDKKENKQKTVHGNGLYVSGNCLVALAEPLSMYRETLMRALFSCNGIKVIAESPCTYALLEKTETECAHIVVAGIELNTSDSFEVLDIISSTKTKLIIHSTFEDEKLIKHFLHFGLYGFVSKYAKLDVLIEAIRGHKTYKHFYLPDKNVPKSHNSFPEINTKHKLLSCREMEILFMICKGKNSPQMAKTLGISSRTVEKIRENMYEKLEIHGLTELLKYAIKNKLFCPYTNMPIKQ